MSPSSTDPIGQQAEQLFREGHLEAAKDKLAEQVQLEPQNAAALTNLGYTEFLLGHHQDALGHCQQAVAVNPNLAEAQANLGAVLLHLGDLPAAKLAFEAGRNIAPHNPMIMTGLGLVHFKQHEFSAAAALHRRAIHADPSYAEPYCNLGLCQLEAMQADTAIENFKIALKLKPGLALARSNLLLAQQYVPGTSPREVKAAFEARPIQDHNEANATRTGGDTDGTLRVGFVSADLWKHPVGYFLQSFFEVPRDDTCEFICYSNRAKSDAVTERLRAACDHWHDIDQLSDQAAADLIKSHHIDILIDLSGHTEGNRLGVFDLKPAPVQLSWLGYFASTGTTAIDGVLLSEDQAPQGAEAFYSEQIHRLRGCQFNYSPAADSALAEVEERQARGENEIIFGCFNNLAKLNSGVIAAWAEILNALPGARLKLKWRGLSDQEICRRVQEQFQRFGITPERLMLSSASPHDEMMREYLDIDIALDPFPFSGALSTCEALWMGTPVVSLRQIRPVSRQTFSILKSLGLSHLCAETPAQYVAIAIQLAKQQAERAELSRTLRSKMAETTPSQASQLAEQMIGLFQQLKSGH